MTIAFKRWWKTHKPYKPAYTGFTYKELEKFAIMLWSAASKKQNEPKKVPVQDKIAENIRRLRGSLNLNQKSFAKEIGVSSTYLNLIENNKKKPPLKLLLEISNKFNIDPSYIVTRNQQGNS